MNIYQTICAAFSGFCLILYVALRFYFLTRKRVVISPLQINLFGSSIELDGFTIYYHRRNLFLTSMVAKHPVFFFRARVLLLALWFSLALVVSSRGNLFFSLGCASYAFLLFVLSVLLDLMALEKPFFEPASILRTGSLSSASLDFDNGYVVLGDENNSAMCPALIGKECFQSGVHIDIFIGFSALGRRFALCSARREG